jgi:hypothetical protein
MIASMHVIRSTIGGYADDTDLPPKTAAGIKREVRIIPFTQRSHGDLKSLRDCPTATANPWTVNSSKTSNGCFAPPTAAVQRGRETCDSGTLLTRHSTDNHFD